MHSIHSDVLVLGVAKQPMLEFGDPDLVVELVVHVVLHTVGARVAFLPVPVPEIVLAEVVEAGGGANDAWG